MQHQTKSIVCKHSKSCVPACKPLYTIRGPPNILFKSFDSYCWRWECGWDRATRNVITEECSSIGDDRQPKGNTKNSESTKVSIEDIGNWETWLYGPPNSYLWGFAWDIIVTRFVEASVANLVSPNTKNRRRQICSVHWAAKHHREVLISWYIWQRSLGIIFPSGHPGHRVPDG